MKCVSVGRLKILDSRTRMLNIPYRSALLAYMFEEIVAICFYVAIFCSLLIFIWKTNLCRKTYFIKNSDSIMRFLSNYRCNARYSFAGLDQKPVDFDKIGFKPLNFFVIKELQLCEKLSKI